MFTKDDPSESESESESKSGHEHSEEENEEPAADAASLGDLARQTHELELDDLSEDDAASVGQEETGHIARAEEGSMLLRGRRSLPAPGVCFASKISRLVGLNQHHTCSRFLPLILPFLQLVRIRPHK